MSILCFAEKNFGLSNWFFLSFFSQVREAFNPYSVLELTAGDVGEVSYASTFGFWILVIRREIVIIRRVIVMIRRGNMKFLTSLSGENPGSGDRPLLSHGLKGDAGNRTNFKQQLQN